PYWPIPPAVSWSTSVCGTTFLLQKFLPLSPLALQRNSHRPQPASIIHPQVEKCVPGIDHRTVVYAYHIGRLMCKNLLLKFAERVGDRSDPIAFASKTSCLHVGLEQPGVFCPNP